MTYLEESFSFEHLSCSLCLRCIKLYCPYHPVRHIEMATFSTFPVCFATHISCVRDNEGSPFLLNVDHSSLKGKSWKRETEFEHKLFKSNYRLSWMSKVRVDPPQLLLFNYKTFLSCQLPLQITLSDWICCLPVFIFSHHLQSEASYHSSPSENKSQAKASNLIERREKKRKRNEKSMNTQISFESISAAERSKSF